MTRPSGMVEKHHPRNPGPEEQHEAEPLMNSDHSRRTTGEEELNICLFPTVDLLRSPSVRGARPYLNQHSVFITTEPTAGYRADTL